MIFGHLISSLFLILILILDEKCQQIYFQLNSYFHEHPMYNVYIIDFKVTQQAITMAWQQSTSKRANKRTHKIVADVKSFIIFSCFNARRAYSVLAAAVV